MHETSASNFAGLAIAKPEPRARQKARSARLQAALDRAVYAHVSERVIRPRGQGRAPKACEQCGATFMVRLADVDAGMGRFCKARCRYDNLMLSSVRTFWSKVEKTDSCWLFRPAVPLNGYGQLMIHGKPVRANRYSWEFHNGLIPPGLWVLHTCDRPPCVNPAHLFLGDRSANMRDAAAKGRLDQQINPLRRRGAVATLTAEQAVQIKREYATGTTTLQALGDRFGVTKNAIWRVVRGLTWRDACGD